MCEGGGGVTCGLLGALAWQAKKRAVCARGTFLREPALQSGAEGCFTVSVISSG